MLHRVINGICIYVHSSVKGCTYYENYELSIILNVLLKVNGFNRTSVISERIMLTYKTTPQQTKDLIKNIVCIFEIIT